MLATVFSPSAKRLAVVLLILSTVLFGGFWASRVRADQPHMEAALDHLRAARQELEVAAADKGGHRANAILLVNDAIDQVERGIEYARHVNIPLPPPIAFGAPPAVIVLPDTDDVYAVPDREDMFFWDGWWWRHWEGGWYRSQYYDRGWGYYDRVPTFYFDVDPYWRRYYRDHDWHGHRWDYDRIPYDRLQQNWHSWHNDRHWEREGTWGVHDYRPRPLPQREELRQQREQEYHQRPEVQQHQQQRQPQVEKQQQQRQPQVEKQQQQRQPQVEKQQKQRQQPQDSQSQGQPEGREEDHRR